MNTKITIITANCILATSIIIMSIAIGIYENNLNKVN